MLRYARQHPDRVAGLVLIESATETLLPHAPSEIPDVAPDGSQLPTLDDIPLVVITIDTQEYMLPPMPNVSSDEALKLWRAAQAELVTLSSQGTQVFVKDTNHHSILASHAEDVIHAVTMVVNRVMK